MIANVIVLAFLAVCACLVLWAILLPKKNLDYPDLPEPTPWWIFPVGFFGGLIGIVACLYLNKDTSGGKDIGFLQTLVIFGDIICFCVAVFGACETYRIDQRRKSDIEVRKNKKKVPTPMPADAGQSVVVQLPSATRPTPKPKAEPGGA